MDFLKFFGGIWRTTKGNTKEKLCKPKTDVGFRGLIFLLEIFSFLFLDTICRPKISPPKVIYKVQSMPYKSLPLGAFRTIFGRNFPTGVLQLLYPYQPANPLVESIFKALFFIIFVRFLKLSNYIWATDRISLHDGSYVR